MATRKVWLVRSALLLLCLVLVAGGTLAYLMRPRPTYNLAADGIAIGGYDPVSYFPEGGAVPRLGDPRFTATQEGRIYRFVSLENQTRFRSDPERYEPLFGGWCAQAVAGGYKFEVDPTSHLLVGDRLLLFYRGLLGDARAEFEKTGVDASVARARVNWSALEGAR